MKSVFLRTVIFSLVFATAWIAPLTLTSATATEGAKLSNARNTNVVSLDDPEATYQGARIVHNVTVSGKKGMRVHAKFTVKHGLDVECSLIAYFYYDDEDNTPLKAGDRNFRTKEGNVSAHSNFTPAYDPAVYNDLQIFVPYDALNMESGEEHSLKFYLALYDKEGERFFGKSTWYKFTLTMP